MMARTTWARRNHNCYFVATAENNQIFPLYPLKILVLEKDLDNADLCQAANYPTCWLKPVIECIYVYVMYKHVQ